MGKENESLKILRVNMTRLTAAVETLPEEYRVIGGGTGKCPPARTPWDRKTS